MTEKLFLCRFPCPNSVQRLFCFPWAGGGAMFYANWGKYLSEETEVHSLLLPGRESRMKDPLATDFSQVIDETCKVISTKFADKPFAFFGHSMGALLSFFSSKKLKEKYNLEPTYLFISGMVSPHSDHFKKRFRVGDSTEDQFIQYLQRLGGTPPEIFTNSEYKDLFFPVIQADYKLMDEIEFDLIPEKPPLTCPIDIFEGEDDHKKDIEEWKKLTSSHQTSIQMFAGGHFYLKETENMEAIIRHIKEKLKSQCLFMG